MIRQKEQPSPEKQMAEPETGRPAGTGEEWLGRNRSSKRRLWERLNPRSRKQIYVIAQALALQQTHARLPEPLRTRLSAAEEDNMFKVKTDFGYVLVEKDKISKIIPSTPTGKSEPQPTAKKDAAQHSPKPTADSQPQAEQAVASGSEAPPTSTNASAKLATASTPGKADKSSPKVTSVAVKPELPAGGPAGNVAAPAIKGSSAAPANAMASSPTTPAPPKEPEVPANREQIQGSLYTNYTHGFRMYKAPSWNLIEEARNALPNAIVAMGTSNE